MRRSLLCVLLLTCLGFDWPGKVHRLQQELEHAEPARRRELVGQLPQYGAPAIADAVLFALEDSDASVRLAAAAVAGRVRLTQATPILLDWLDDKEADTRGGAASALGLIGDARSLAPLTRALGDSAAEVRRAACQALGRLGLNDAVVPLIGRLEDTDLDVRVNAIGALAILHDPQALLPLQNAAADTSAEVRSAALSSLGRLRDARSVPVLTRGLADEVEAVRLASAAALGLLGTEGVERALTANLDRTDPRTGQAIVTALGNVDDDAARALLIARLRIPVLRPTAALSLVRQARNLARKTSTVADANLPTPLDGFVVSLATALRKADAAERPAVADVLSEVAESGSIVGAVPTLLEALQTSTEQQSPSLLRALGMSGSPDALMPLLERMGQAQAADVGPVLSALLIYFEHASPDGRAADPLLDRFNALDAKQRVNVVELLGKVGAARAVPLLSTLLTQPDVALAVSAVQAIAAIAAPETGPLLVPLLASDDARTRYEAARALRATADAGLVQQLVDRLSADQAEDRHALLVAIGGGLARLSRTAALPDSLRITALRALDVLIAGPDDGLSDRAIDALAVWAPQDAIDHMGPALRSPSSRRRAVATLAVGQLDAEAARPLLRYLLQHGSPGELHAAAIALGEAGDERDLHALARAAKRYHWPVPAAAAYSLGRFAERGLLRPHAARALLCELGRSREPYVRANVAVAMAAMAAAPCDADGPNPLIWLTAQHAAVVRAAAARWIHAALAAGHIDPAAAGSALVACAEDDVEARVRELCESPLPTPTARREPADLYPHAADGTTLLRNRLVAVRFSSGAVMVTRSDANGHVRLKSAPSGEVRLDDPGLLPLESPN
jgi:HEAT repeat protein